ncbi:hypothetical protein Ptr902_01341 [Pyrenophora tritici-repentis]|uniref:Uncharacterized protein n=1 Tax=Pyrenophora tritici-repentis TaxID=45151 RepID=A0A2W1E792_9PLEO|nr:hypothetical protein Ptr86124_007249 [Pyrenophora tritici-repentis]KAI1529330.1 hypothetical protein PtrSN001A_008629 [Pyrenophora tritici-repentis]KAI1538145.1 hypothetical protein PtrSN001C_005844 [Pyrenophora tritici-repentis]KAI1573796.1 hypothetical protein PtrEW4_003537 [Pyrenophora tritici-repentis]KAI1576532.1 hypothetical protein PtrEW7m1_006212 [Pyrenophora tritici-repentis]
MPRPPSSPSPPPASFSFTGGGFDFPHASTSPPTVSRTTITSASRSALRPNPQHTPALHDAEPAPRPTARRTRNATRRGSLHRIFGPPRDSDAVDNLSRRPPTANPNRPRATPSERYLRRSQARIREQRSADMDSPNDVLDSLSDLPITNPFTAPSYAQSRPRSPIVQVNSERRHKRRKLQHDSSAAPEYMCFKYGHKGQVVSGRLRMEIVSCDGGEHRRDNPPGLYRVQNVLKNDKSVYCSESSQCNLLLKHIGEAPFALEKVVIRAPDRGFTAPVQEGLVFVSMSADHLLAGTSAYNLRYDNRSPLMSPTPSSPTEDNEHISLREALQDPSIWQYSHQGTQEDMEERIENLRLRSERLNAESVDLISSLRSDSERRRILRQMVEHEDEADGDNCDHAGEESYSGPAGVSAPTPPPFTVTTAASEEESSDSNEEQPSAAIMADRLRRESRWRPDSDDDDDEIIPRMGPLRRAPALDYTSMGEWRERRERYLEPIRASRVAAPSRIEPSESSPDTDVLIPPHARFFIAKNKNKITIKFHPAM